MRVQAVCHVQRLPAVLTFKLILKAGASSILALIFTALSFALKLPVTACVLSVNRITGLFELPTATSHLASLVASLYICPVSKAVSLRESAKSRAAKSRCQFAQSGVLNAAGGQH